MEKNIMLQAENARECKFELAELFKGIGEWLSAPARLLCEFYSAVLERRMTMRQTYRLIEAQVAFFCGIMPVDISVVSRLLLFAWFVSAVMRYRKSLD